MSGILDGLGLGEVGLGGSGSTSGGVAGGLIPLGNQSSPQFEAFVKGYLGKDPGLNIGPLILGLALDLLLFGVSWHQFIMYLSYPGKDRWFIKGTVFWVMLVSTATSAYGMFFVYELFVRNFGTWSPFLRIDNIGIYCVLDVITTAPVQVFFLERAYRLLNNNKAIPVVVGPIILASVVSGFGLCFVMQDIGNYLNDLTRMKSWFYGCDVSILVADVLLTGLLYMGLNRAKTGWAETDKLVSKLIRMSVEAQLPATIYALAMLITYSIDSRSQVNTFWVMQHPKIYVVSLLAVLNFRTTLRAMGTGSSRMGVSDRAEASDSSPYRSRGSRKESYPLDRITVNTDTYQQTHSISLPRAGLNRTFTAESGNTLPRASPFEAEPHMQEPSSKAERAESIEIWR